MNIKINTPGPQTLQHLWVLEWIIVAKDDLTDNPVVGQECAP